jgi:tRNA pseudouridine38-40 synthase
MERYQIILAYNGARFLGSQRQANSRTVQGVLEIALQKLGWVGRSALMAGRTDTGVHASGQVASFDLDWQHTEDALLRALNANLPSDVAVREVRKTSLDFHPRFDATSRRYRYRLFCQPVRDPLREDFAWRIRREFDGDLLGEVAPAFIGQHDFLAYGTPPRTGSSTMRIVMKSEWQQHKDEWHYEVQANAFLYRMVRRMVFVQVAVAQGKISIDDVAHSLAGQVETPLGSDLPAGLAPADGLTLVEVIY